MTSLTTADLHLTDNTRDEYRWELFPWIAKQKWDELLLLGDITDSKDRHSQALVNRVVGEIYSISKRGKVVIIPGNHDFIDEKNPFFRFLSVLPNVIYITEPKIVRLHDGDGYFIPCMRSGFPRIKDGPYEWVFTHQTFDGAKAENGQALTGVDPDLIDRSVQVISGDVHTPQKVRKNIQYVGAPYRIHFGDTFKPRLLLIHHKGQKDLHFPGKSRHLIELTGVQSLKDTGVFSELVWNASEINLGDQIKVRVRLKKADYPSWPKMRSNIKRDAEKLGLQLCGLELAELKTSVKQVELSKKQLRSPETLVKEYAKAHKLSPEMTKIGLELLDE